MSDFILEIHFPFSRSKTYPDVMKHARLFSDFSEKPNVLRITNPDELFGRWDAFSIVIFGTTKWAGTNVYFDGKPVLPYKNDFFYKLLDIKHCYGQYKNCADKTGFCSAADWGCHRLKHIGRYFKLSAYYVKNPFYKFGYFKDSETWLIDKERILNVISEEARLGMINKCPAFNLDRVKKAIAELPDQIKIGGNWEIDYKLGVGSNGILGIPESINFITNPEPEPQAPEDEFIDPEEDMDGFLDKLLRDREKNRKDDYSDLL